MIEGSDKQFGATLIEVLVAFSVLAMAMLSMAAFQSKSLALNRTAYFNTQANMMAADMLERIRVNHVRAIGSGYSLSKGTSATSWTTACEIADCSPGNLLEYDIKQWKYSVQKQLPKGDGAISRRTVSGLTEYTVTVYFSDDTDPNTLKEVAIRSTL